MKTANLVSLALACAAWCAYAQSFDDAVRAFRAGECEKAVQIGRKAIKNSPHAPAQVREDNEAAIARWKEASRECENSLPREYHGQLKRFEKEYRDIAAMKPGAAKSDAGCELLRKVSLFVTGVKRVQAGCPCNERSREIDAFLGKMVTLCPEPCSNVDKDVEDILKRVTFTSDNLRFSRDMLRDKKINSFRKQIRIARSNLLGDQARADSIMNNMDFCLGRKGNRNLGLIAGTAGNLARGLGYLDEMCGVIQNFQQQVRPDSVRNQLFRDSVNNFFNQVSSVMDQWLRANMAGDSSTNLFLQKTTSQKMHDMFIKLAKIELERSLLFLDGPINEKQCEIKRLKTLSFPGELAYEETRELDAMRTRVAHQLYVSIPWPIRFWEAERVAAILIITLGLGFFITTLVLLSIIIRGRKKKQQPPEIHQYPSP